MTYKAAIAAKNHVCLDLKGEVSWQIQQVDNYNELCKEIIYDSLLF